MNLEMNMKDIRRDSDFHVENGLNEKSPVVEVFSKMVMGQEIGEIRDRNGRKVDVDVMVNHIKGLAFQAGGGNQYAATELNEIRRYVIWPLIQRRLQFLSLFGRYEQLPYGTTPVVEPISIVGQLGRAQANRGDVVFGAIQRDAYPVKPQSIAAGHQIDYRKTSAGDMSVENLLISRIETDLWNRLTGGVISNIYNTITNYNGVKFMAHGTGVTKTAVDWIINNIRRWGNVSVYGDQAVTSQFGGFAGYAATTPVLNAMPAPAPVTAQGISQAMATEYLTTGFVARYLGANIITIDNGFNVGAQTVDGNGNLTYETMFPQGFLFFSPTGAQSPVRTWVIGDGLTSLTGTDIETGTYITRFDLMYSTDLNRNLIAMMGLYVDDSFPLPGTMNQ